MKKNQIHYIQDDKYILNIMDLIFQAIQLDQNNVILSIDVP
ncbi:hypothetical protein HDF25_003305 [Pedobacter cryoconitis]|uniref:Uncharacterized protein n=1 Tax=Pedobacter cryoconitis TaxID=188932 RepID=A0A7X0J6A0_9SPHI|nr:hypothetical protein [Pedobacter cryoconitis]